jgi:hypothetical protein
VLIPDRVFVDPVKHDEEGINERVNRTGDLTGSVALLTAPGARISRLERQLKAERDRANEAQTVATGLRAEVAEPTARADRAEQASTVAEAACQEAQETGPLRAVPSPSQSAGSGGRRRSTSAVSSCVSMRATSAGSCPCWSSAAVAQTSRGAGEVKNQPRPGRPGCHLKLSKSPSIGTHACRAALG